MIPPDLKSLAVSALLEQGLALEMEPAQASASVRAMALASGHGLDAGTSLALDRFCRQIVREASALHGDALSIGLPATDAGALARQVVAGRLDLGNLSGWSLWTDRDLRRTITGYLSGNAGQPVTALTSGILDILGGWTPPSLPSYPPAPSAAELFAQRPRRQARIGAFGEILFEVSAEDVFTLNSLSRSREAVFARHETLAGRPLLQAVGLDLWEVDVSVALDRNFSDPEARLAALERTQAEREHHPLVIGGRVLGRFVLQGIEENTRRFGGSGEILLAEVKLSFLEHVEADQGQGVARVRPYSSPAVRARPAPRTINLADTSWNQGARDMGMGLRADNRR